MSDDKLAQFANQKYINLESYRKNGRAVQTPVWFAEEDGVFYVYSLADAGKVKRIRNNPRVRVVPCSARGRPKGEWVEAKATIVDGAEAELGHKLLTRKYGIWKRIGNLFRKIRKREHAVMTIRFD
ncbi:MAG: PPOX class F420-dependent oxidoreductase [Blastocatellia bacterium]|nr:PPOX class F420-dependent oxidoreductase [Blastocatellia bacterium]